MRAGVAAAEAQAEAAVRAAAGRRRLGRPREQRALHWPQDADRLLERVLLREPVAFAGRRAATDARVRQVQPEQRLLVHIRICRNLIEQTVARDAPTRTCRMAMYCRKWKTGTSCNCGSTYFTAFLKAESLLMFCAAQQSLIVEMHTHTHTHTHTCTLYM